MLTLLRKVQFGAVVCGLLLSAAIPARADVVTQWNLQVFTSGGPQIQRTLAMVHLAMFDALNATNPRYQPYLQLPAPAAGTNGEAAAASAAHGVLLRLFPAQAAALAAQLSASLAPIPNSAGKTAGVLYGDGVANALYQVRFNDNILVAGPVYVNGTTPGVYQRAFGTAQGLFLPLGDVFVAKFGEAPQTGPIVTIGRFRKES